jgi:two-component system C4-dicarboxylate transport response regulator DctD
MELISVSPVMRQIVDEAHLVAKADVSALLMTGEPGVGKEHLARFVHDRARRRERPFVVFSCYPGAQNASTLANALAEVDGGTLFCKGIEHMSEALQTELSDHLTAPRGAAANARIICSGAPTVFDDVQAGRFSTLLYYRLNVVYLPVPPLRDRLDDVEPLLRHFIAASADRQRVPSPSFQSSWRDVLGRHQWPGNVDELRQVADLIVARRPSIALSPSLLIH